MREGATPVVFVDDIAVVVTGKTRVNTELNSIDETIQGMKLQLVYDENGGRDPINGGHKLKDHTLLLHTYQLYALLHLSTNQTYFTFFFCADFYDQSENIPQ